MFFFLVFTPLGKPEVLCALSLYSIDRIADLANLDG